MDEPSTSEQLAAIQRRTFELEVEVAKTEIRVEFAQAVERAAFAEYEAERLRDRVHDLEAALGRRQRARHDAADGLERFR